MTPAQQKYKTLLWKKYGSKVFSIALVPWVQSIVSDYRIGHQTVQEESKDFLRIAHVRAISMIEKKVLGFDTREYKQEEEDLLFSTHKKVSRTLATKVNTQVPKSILSETNTASKWVARTTSLAIINGWTELEARRALKNYLTNQKLIIAVTDSAWTVETVKNTVVLVVNDPLRNSIRRITNLIKAEDYKAAKKLAKEVNRLARMPLSTKQGELVRYINDNRDRLVNPYSQSQVLANVEKRAEKLDKQDKTWHVSGFNTRETHWAADGQTVPVSEPFVLAGGLLQYPMDSSLGADLSEIINCQCYMEYV